LKVQQITEQINEKMQSTITLLSLLVSTTSAVSTLMRFGCDGNIDFGEETLVGPLNLKWNGADKLIKVRRLFFSHFSLLLDNKK
jgi:hypothetical protein